MKVLARVFSPGSSRLSGSGSFPPLKKSDIGREVVVTRPCITWLGCLGYFADDKKQNKFAFYLRELEEK